MERDTIRGWVLVASLSFGAGWWTALGVVLWRAYR